MGILLSIFGVLGSIGSVIGSILKAIPPIVWLCIGCVFFGMWLTWGGCSFSLFPKRPVGNETYEVVSVPTGDSIIVRDGPLGRKRITISLSGIVAPKQGDKFFEQSRHSLEKEVGKKIKINKGVLYGQFETPLCLWQVMAGMADVAPGASRELVKQRNIAKKYNRGIWVKP